MATNEGFNGIVLRHKGLLFAVCRRYARRGLNEEDLLQEVLVVLWLCGACLGSPEDRLAISNLQDK